MANHIPQGFSPNAGSTGGNTDFPPPYIFDDNATVNFRVHKVTENIRKRTFNAGTEQQLIIEDCEMWSFQIVLSDPQDSGLSNMTFLDIIKDGRAWNVESSKGSLWVQNKFLNMCTGFGLRKSKEVLNINPAWFTDIELYTMITGQCTVQKDQYNGKFRNQINWFLEPAEEVQPMSTMVTDGTPVNVTTFNQPVQQQDTQDEIPF